MAEADKLKNADKPLGQRMARGGAWVLLNRVLVAVTQLVTLGLLARLMPPNEMGVYFIISNFVVVAGMFVQLGIPQVVIKRTAETIESGTENDTLAVVQTCLIVSLCSGVIIFVILNTGLGDWLAGTLFDSSLFSQLILLVSLWLVIQAIQRVIGETFRGMHDLRLAAIFGGIFSGLLSTSIFLAISLLYKEATLEQVVWVFLFSIALSFVCALFILHRKIQLFSRLGAIDFKPVLTLAFPILFATLGNIVLMRADIWILGIFVSDSDVALYGAAARIVGLLSTPLLIAAAILAPTIVQLHERNDLVMFQKVVQLVPTILAIPAFVLIAIMILYGEPLLVLIYGDSFYAGSSSVLTILAIGQLACLLAGVSIQILFLTVSQVAAMVVTVICTVCTIAIAVMAVEPYGIDGVAVAFAVGVGMQSLICMLICRLKLGINAWLSIRHLLGLKTILKSMREDRKRRKAQAM